MILGIIPARGGSKRLRHKNLREVGGVTLVGWALASARQATRLGHVLVSTDSDDIARATAKHDGHWVLRPYECATDDAPLIWTLQHAVEFHEWHAKEVVDATVLLQPTTPFRTGQIIDECVAQLVEGVDSVVAVGANGRPNGEVYVSRRALIDAGRILGPRCVDYRSMGPAINIDTEYDLVLAERHHAAHHR